MNNGLNDGCESGSAFIACCSAYATSIVLPAPRCPETRNERPVTSPRQYRTSSWESCRAASEAMSFGGFDSDASLSGSGVSMMLIGMYGGRRRELVAPVTASSRRCWREASYRTL